MLIISLSFLAIAQDNKKDFDDKDGSDKIFRFEDRAGGTHNASNIGLFFENRGKLYPRRITQGPSGEFPINSTKHYIYRINQMVGVPGNVVQSRFTTSTAAFRPRIQNERNVELSWEGHYYYDIRRWKTASRRCGPRPRWRCARVTMPNAPSRCRR